MDDKKLEDLIKARRASTRAELTRKATEYILEQAGIDAKEAPEQRREEGTR